MQRNTTREPDARQRQQTILNTAQAEAAALHGIYRDTLSAFITTPNAVPVPRAARSLYWLGRLRQWRAIDLNAGETCQSTNWLSLQLGVIEAVTSTHALALHKEQWSGPSRRQTYERDMALQIAMLLTLGWRDLAAFTLRAWFGVESDLAGAHPISGIAGMIVGISGAALDVPVAHTAFQKSDLLLGQTIEQWHEEEPTFAPLVVQLADRHISQCRLDTNLSLYDFDHPVEQAVPVELLMLLRLRGFDRVPPWLSRHPALQHPAATFPPVASPVQSQRCTSFIKRVTHLLPQYDALTVSIAAQAASFQMP